jgi:hypothetical protein
LVCTIAYKRVVYLDVTYGEYRARCSCCTTSRTTPPGIEPRAPYDNAVRQAVLDRILGDGMSVERVIASMRRDFYLDLSDGFVYDCLDRQARRLDLAAHRRWVLERFSGALCVDELHLGRMTLLLATDPLQDLPVAFALVAKNDHDDMRRFLKNLKAWGLMPEVVVTDGSNLYPAILAGLWPGCRHQLCSASSMPSKNFTSTSWMPSGVCVGGCPGGARGDASGSEGAPARAGPSGVARRTRRSQRSSSSTAGWSSSAGNG